MRLCILISVVCVLTAFGSAQTVPGFDPREVVRQVQTRGDMTAMTSDATRAALHPGNRFPEPPEANGAESVGGAEFLIDTSSALVPAPGSQNDPAVAFDGANFLVVWEDHRSGTYSDICGARVTPEGEVLEPSGFVISQAAYDQRYPALCFDGANFLVVWQDYRRGHAFDIYGARVTPAGEVLDLTGFVISQAMNDQQKPALVFDGTNFLVVWQDCVNDVEAPDIYGARVTPQGAVLDTSGIVIAEAARSQYDPVVGFGGVNFLVVWQDCRDSGDADIYGTLVTPQGEVILPDGFAISPAGAIQGTPALGFDGENFFVAWQDVRGSFPPQLSIYGSRVTPGGMVLDREGIAISQGGGGRGAPAVGSDGENFLVTWQEGRGPFDNDIYGARVTPEGEVLDTSGFVIAQGAGMQMYPAIGFDTANFLVVWQDYRNNPGEPDIYGARVTPEGEVLDTNGLIIAQAARDQYTPALGFDGVNFLVVWEDHPGGYSDIYGARVTPEGEVLDPSPFAITHAANDQFAPALGFDGANFLVVWQDYRDSLDEPDIYGARVTPGGVVLDTDGIAISRAPDRQCFPALAFDGANFLAVWQDQRGGSNNIDIYGARVTPGGTVLDTSGFAIAHAADWQRTPAAGFGGASFLVAWEDCRNSRFEPDIYGARVTPAGTVLDTSGFAISRAVSGQYDPALGFDGTNFLVVWEDYRRSIYPDIYGARVTPGGKVLDTTGIAVSRGLRDQCTPALAFDDTNFLVVWADYRSGSPDIYGTRVTPAGVVFDTGAIVWQKGSQSNPALALGTGGQMLLVYQGWVGAIGNKTYNTDRIWGRTDPSPTGIEESEQPEGYGYRPLATIVRGVLFLAEAPSRKPQAASLLDIAGRKVLDLHPGANDIRALAPGVYFVRDSGHEGRTRKVIVQR